MLFAGAVLVLYVLCGWALWTLATFIF